MISLDIFGNVVSGVSSTSTDIKINREMLIVMKEI